MTRIFEQIWSMYNCRAHGLVLSTYSDEIRCRPLTLSRTDCRNGRGRGIVHDFVWHTCSQITAAWDCLPLSTRRPPPERLPPTSGNLTKQMSGIRHLKPCAVGPQAMLWLFSIAQRAPVRAPRQRKEPAVLCGARLIRRPVLRGFLERSLVPSMVEQDVLTLLHE